MISLSKFLFSAETVCCFDLSVLFCKNDVYLVKYYFGTFCNAKFGLILYKYGGKSPVYPESNDVIIESRRLFGLCGQALSRVNKSERLIDINGLL